MKKQNSKKIPFWISLAVLLVCWHFLTVSGQVGKLFLPGFRDLAISFRTLFEEKHFAGDIAVSVRRIFFSFALSFVTAVPLALLMSESKLLFSILSPYIDFIRYLPVPALIPLCILFFGIDESAKIVLLFTGTFFQFILMILDDIREIPKEYYDIAFTLQYSRQELLRMKMRAILPQIYDNSRISIGICWTYLVIAELVASESGVGHMIKEAQRFSATPDIYAGIITIGLTGFLTDWLFKKMYPVIFSYKNESDGQRA